MRARGSYIIILDASRARTRPSRTYADVVALADRGIVTSSGNDAQDGLRIVVEVFGVARTRGVERQRLYGQKNGLDGDGENENEVLLLRVEQVGPD